MKKEVYTMLAMMVLLGCIAVSAQAQCNSGAQSSANIPFQFSVGWATLPAGEYGVTCLDPEHRLLQIRSSDGKAASTMLMIQLEGQAQNHGRLVFHRYGARYFLAQVWTGGNERGSELPKTRAECNVERELKGMKPKSAEVALTKRR